MAKRLGRPVDRAARRREALTDTSSDPERPRRTLNLGIRRKRRPEPTSPEQSEEQPTATELSEEASQRAASEGAVELEARDQGSRQSVATELSEDASRKRPLFRRKPRPSPPSEEESSSGVGPTAEEAGRPPTPGRLHRERRALIEQRQVDVYHLGGLAFEAYRRGLLEGEALTEKALAIAALDTRVRDLDAQLEEIEDGRRVRRAAKGRRDADPTVGACVTCRTEFGADAAYCWRCGAHVNPNAGAAEHDTAVIGPVAS